MAALHKTGFSVFNLPCDWIILKTSELYKKAMTDVPPSKACGRSSSHSPRWQPPQPGHVTVNVDVALQIEGVSSIGAIARNKEGDVLWAAGKNLYVQPSPVAGEALAIKFGLELAKSIGLQANSEDD
ncbi:hypothetical protein AKJ16_DCAP09513 [Drosera capensis]